MTVHEEVNPKLLSVSHGMRARITFRIVALDGPVEAGRRNVERMRQSVRLYGEGE
jgi:hypothetical protein